MQPLQGNWLLTGGAGYLGRGIIRQAIRDQWDCRFTVFSRDEEKHRRLMAKYGGQGIEIECLLGEVTDYQGLCNVMMGLHGVIHAAAIKFIPDAERNTWQTARVNIDGTRFVARAAAFRNLQRAIFISTDKACLPANFYGMTKALGERFFAEANRWREPTIFSSVRYGNVVGSTGSVVPVFRDQRKRFGRLKVTSKEMTRFWMGVDEAVGTVLLAAQQSEREAGSVYVPQCRAMRLIDLAELIAEGMPVDETQPRPGEKMHEHLITPQESERVELREGYYVVHPATWRPATGVVIDRQFPTTYTSDKPAAWVTPEEMALLIADGEEV